MMFTGVSRRLEMLEIFVYLESLVIKSKDTLEAIRSSLPQPSDSSQPSPSS
jgi:hypothetical protein